MRLDITVEVIRDQVVITMVYDCVDDGRELIHVAEHARTDGVEDFLQVWIDRVRAVGVVVTEIFDVLGEVAEKEDVVVTDFASDFDLESVSSGQVWLGDHGSLTYICTIASANDQSTIQHKLHVARARSLRSSSRNVL